MDTNKTACNCHNVRYQMIIDAVKDGADTYEKLQEIVREDSPWIFMSFATSASLHHDTLLNYLPHDFPYGMEKHLRKR